MFGWFSEKSPIYRVDVHSHLLPGLDDGVKTYEEALEILRFFDQIGLEKVITTPHIYTDVYPNSERSILERFLILEEKMVEQGIKLKLEVAAEYFVDQQFLNQIKSGADLMTWGENYILIETAFYNKPILFGEVIFSLKARGLTPVLAHPERYHFLDGDLSWVREQAQSGVLLQVNTMSLVGTYGPTAQKLAQKLLKESLVSFLGSDIHRASQIPLLKRALNKNVRQTLLNDQI